MALGPRLDLRQAQSLVMTPQLRQAIKLLQFSNLEVAAFVEEALERNPLLERDEQTEALPERPAPDQVPIAGGAERDVTELVAEGGLEDRLCAAIDAGETYDPGTNADFYRGGGGADPALSDDLAEQRPSLRAVLTEQMRLSFADPTERLIGACLIAMLDPAGRIPNAMPDLAARLGATLAQVESVRARMQRFDPAGLFCVDLRECLAAQLAERNRLDPAMQTLLDNLELLARRDLRRLMQLCGVDHEDLAGMIAEIRALDPKPAAGFDAAPLQPLIPDVLMRRARDEAGAPGWVVELNPETLPRVLVNHGLSARLHGRGAREDRAYAAEQLQSANWLVKSLQQRAQTILRVAQEIIRQQDGFFRHGVSHLRPLILRDIADAVELHESTVSRVTANKYIATPRGTLELKFFFTAAIAGTDGESHSAEAVRHRIRALVGAESAAKVLSDDAIVSVLRREGVDIARRTVAKYREALHIPSSVQRKRDKLVPA